MGVGVSEPGLARDDKVELEVDAWDRFEQAIDSLLRLTVRDEAQGDQDWRPDSENGTPAAPR